MEKFFFCLILTADKLNIVYQKNINISEFISEIIKSFFENGINKFVCKIL